MVGCVVSDDVDHRRRRLVGIVDIGEPIGHAGAEVQEGRRRVARHPGVAVGRTSDDTLEKTQHTAHPIDPVERGDKMHFRRAGIGETHIDPAPDQGPHQAFRAVHDAFSDGLPWRRSMPAARFDRKRMTLR
jgi:hypothetical protein